MATFLCRGPVGGIGGTLSSCLQHAVQNGSRGGRCFRRKSATSGLKSVLPRPLWPFQRKAGKMMTLSSASWHSPRLATPLLIFRGMVIAATMSSLVLKFKPALSSFQLSLQNSVSRI
jgi:hypothetical protein